MKTTDERERTPMSGARASARFITRTRGGGRKFWEAAVFPMLKRPEGRAPRRWFASGIGVHLCPSVVEESYAR